MPLLKGELIYGIVFLCVLLKVYLFIVFREIWHDQDIYYNYKATVTGTGKEVL